MKIVHPAMNPQLEACETVQELRVPFASGFPTVGKSSKHVVSVVHKMTDTSNQTAPTPFGSPVNHPKLPPLALLDSQRGNLQVGLNLTCPLTGK